MNDNLVWWMSLSRTEKNNRMYVEKLVIDTENLIVEENRKWLGSSQSTSIKLIKENTYTEEEKKENENEILIQNYQKKFKEK